MDNVGLKSLQNFKIKCVKYYLILSTGNFCRSPYFQKEHFDISIIFGITAFSSFIKGCTRGGIGSFEKGLDCVHTMPAYFENGEKFDG